MSIQMLVVGLGVVLVRIGGVEVSGVRSRNVLKMMGQVLRSNRDNHTVCVVETRVGLSVFASWKLDQTTINIATENFPSVDALDHPLVLLPSNGAWRQIVVPSYPMDATPWTTTPTLTHGANGCRASRPFSVVPVHAPSRIQPTGPHST